MTYRHIYTDPNPCPCCQGYRTEPRAYYPTPDYAGGGRKCADCGTARPDAFDPDRDPFNPEREGWTGWGGNNDTWALPSSGGNYDAVVLPGSGEQFSRTSVELAWVDGCIYDAAFIPHRTVVSILVSNGYVPST